MESEIEIVQPKKISYKKIFVSFFIILLLCLIGFFGYRAFALTKKIIVARSSSASPYLSGESDLTKTDISKFESGDRRINILLLGMGGENHPGGNLTDTIQVISIDPKNKEVAMLSIPRDLHVKIKGFGFNKINSVYSLEEDGSYDNQSNKTTDVKNSNSDVSKHMDLMKKTLSDLLGVPIHYAVVVNFDGFKKIIDILGGVDVNVTKEIYDPLYPDKYVEGYDEFFMSKGMHTMDGETALKYARSRETTSDFDRSRRQQEIMIAAKDKAENSISISKISQIMNVLSDNLKTDLQPLEIEELAKIAKDIKKENIKTKVLDDAEDGLLYADKVEEMYVLLPKDSTLKETQMFVSQYFKDPLLSEEKSKIVLINGTKSEYTINKIYEDLKTYGYDVSIIENQEKKSYAKTFIYDYSNNSKKATLDFLKKFLNNIPVINLDEKDKGYDIEIIIGDDFKSSLQNGIN